MEITEDNSSSNTDLMMDSCSDSEHIRHVVSFYMMGVVAMFISMIGVGGNALCLAVLARPSMRTSNTHKYLMALAISDSLVLLATICTAVKDTRMNKIAYIPPPEITYLFLVGHPVSIWFQVCSVWLTVAFTADRYFMVCHPFRAQRVCLKRHMTFVVIVVIYLSATIYNIPRFFEFEIRTLFVEDDKFTNSSSSNDTFSTDERHMTYIQWSARSEFGKTALFLQAYHLWSWLLLVACLPLCSISFMNFYLIKEIHQSKQRQRSIVRRQKESPAETKSTEPHSASTSMTALRAHRQDTNVMLVSIIVIFLMCQFPVAVCHVLYALVEEHHGVQACRCLTRFIFNEVANVLIVFNSAINIIPYYFFGRNFRREFRNMLREWSFMLSCCPARGASSFDHLLPGPAAHRHQENLRQNKLAISPDTSSSTTRPRSRRLSSLIFCGSGTQISVDNHYYPDRRGSGRIPPPVPRSQRRRSHPPANRETLK